VLRLNPSLFFEPEAGSVLRHAKEAESHGFTIEADARECSHASVGHGKRWRNTLPVEESYK
jgi:hypothetical protein